MYQPNDKIQVKKSFSSLRYQSFNVIYNTFGSVFFHQAFTEFHRLSHFLAFDSSKTMQMKNPSKKKTEVIFHFFYVRLIPSISLWKITFHVMENAHFYSTTLNCVVYFHCNLRLFEALTHVLYVLVLFAVFLCIVFFLCHSMHRLLMLRLHLSLLRLLLLKASQEFLLLCVVFV